MFTGFTDATVEYFLNLRFHNYHSFFQETKETYYQDVRQPFYDLIEELAPVMLEIDPEIEVRPHKCLARLHRDTRFSKDKSPYRDHLWFLFRKSGEPREGSVMYWFEFGPDRLEWGLGFWGENKEAMELLRRRMAAQPRRFMDLIDDCRMHENKLRLGGYSYKRLAVPENIPPALADWYVKKDLYIFREAPPYRWAFEPKLAERIAKDFKLLAPMYRTLRGALNDLQAE